MFLVEVLHLHTMFMRRSVIFMLAVEAFTGMASEDSRRSDRDIRRKPETWGPLGQRRRPGNCPKAKSCLRCSQPCQCQLLSPPPIDRSDGLPCPYAVLLALSGLVTS